MNPKRVIFSSVITYFVKLMSKKPAKRLFLNSNKVLYKSKGFCSTICLRKRQYSNNNTITEVINIIKIARPVQCKTSFKCVLSRQMCYLQKSGDLKKPMQRWKKRTDASKLSSDLTGTMSCTHPHIHCAHTQQWQ